MLPKTPSPYPPPEEAAAPPSAVSASPAGLRLGVDLGGTKIAAALLAPDGAVQASRRVATPDAYDATLRAILELCDGLAPRALPVGVGIPGSVSPTTGLVRNANTTFLNGRDLAGDLARASGRRVRLANDANCFALSEAMDGAAAGSPSVFGIIIGTGVGGGLVIDGNLVQGANGIAGEWGHTPLPWPSEGERGAHACWCGRVDCMETWASGPALEADYARPGVRAPEIAARAQAGEPDAMDALNRYVSRLARGVAVICNVFDPHTIVLGGGLSNIEALYDALPAAMRPHLFTDAVVTQIVCNRHGDDSGVRGAAWLWPAGQR